MLNRPAFVSDRQRLVHWTLDALCELYDGHSLLIRLAKTGAWVPVGGDQIA